VPLRLSDIATLAQLQAQGVLSLLPKACEALLEAAGPLVGDYELMGTLSRSSAAQLQASLALLLGIPAKEAWAKSVLAGKTMEPAPAAGPEPAAAAAVGASGPPAVQADLDLIGAELNALLAADGPQQQQQEQEGAADAMDVDAAEPGAAAAAAAGDTAGGAHDAAATAAAAGGQGDEGDTPGTPSSSDGIDQRLHTAIVLRVPGWHTCSGSYINAYLGELQGTLALLEQQQQQTAQACQALMEAASKAASRPAGDGSSPAAADGAGAAAAAAGGGGGGGSAAGGGGGGSSGAGGVSDMEVDPCVSGLVQRVFDALLAPPPDGDTSTQQQPQQQQQQQREQGQPGRVQDASAGGQGAGGRDAGLPAAVPLQAVEQQVSQLLSQLDDALLLLRAEILSVAPYR